MPDERSIRFWFQDDQALLGISAPQVLGSAQPALGAALRQQQEQSPAVSCVWLWATLSKIPPCSPLLPLLVPRGLQLLCSTVRSSLKLFPYFPGSLSTIRALKPQESSPRSSSRRGVGRFNTVHYTSQIKSISYFFH